MCLITTWISLDSSKDYWGVYSYLYICSCVPSGVKLLIMGSPMFPRESGQFIAEKSRDVFVEEEGVQNVAEMLYNLRHSDDLTASGWKKENPLAPAPTSDQGSASTAGATQRNILFLNKYTWEVNHVVHRKLCSVETEIMMSDRWFYATAYEKAPHRFQ